MKYVLCLLCLCMMTVLAKSRTWTSSSGKTIDASFVNVHDGMFQLRDAEGRDRKIPFNKLSKQDQALVRKLAGARMGAGAIKREDGKLPVWADGPHRERNMILALEHYRAVLQDSGDLVIRPTQGGKETGPALVVKLHRVHVDSERPPASRHIHQEIVAFEEAPAPSKLNQPTKIALKGKFEDQSTFELAIELTEDGAELALEYQEKRASLPTMLLLCAYIVPSVKTHGKELATIQKETAGWEMSLRGPRVRETHTFWKGLKNIPGVELAKLQGPWGKQRVEVQMEEIRSREGNRWGAFQIYNGQSLCDGGRSTLALQSDREKAAMTVSIK